MSRKPNFVFGCRMVCGGLVLPFVLSGCGGSSNSNTATYTGTDTTATINAPMGALQFNGYSINIAPSGAATYSATSQGQSAGQIVTRTGSGTVSTAITGKFFQDLAAAVPVSKLPAYTEAKSAGASAITVTYQRQTGPINNTDDARELALEADANAISQALGVFPN